MRLHWVCSTLPFWLLIGVLCIPSSVCASTCILQHVFAAPAAVCRSPLYRKTFFVNPVDPKTKILTRLLEAADVKLGETVKVRLPNNLGSMRMKAVAKQPLAYLIDDFLTEAESDALIAQAKKIGLKTSITSNPDQKDNKVMLFDINKDKKLSLDEMRVTIEGSFDFYLTKEDILNMYKELKIDKNEDTFLDMEELKETPPYKFQEYLVKQATTDTMKRSRLSTHTWMFPDDKKHMEHPVFSRMVQRTQTLLGLSEHLMKTSDFQVVFYPSGGHYHAHYDSSMHDPKDPGPCCQRSLKSGTRCRSCRFLTLLVYLHEPRSGGHTAFPLADNSTFDETSLRLNNNMNLNQEMCDEVNGRANLLVRPRKGTAILWYNHYVDSKTGWQGEMDLRGLHGGCPVLEGQKWIGNFWVKPDNKP